MIHTKTIPVLSIIIVNYNGMKFLAECFDSIMKHVTCSFEIIVVDNASIDGSCEFISKNYPDVRLIVSPINTGFTGGNNLGSEIAQGEYLLLLNNDTVVLSDIFPAVNRFQNSTLGALGCHLVYGDGSFQTSFGFDHTPLRIILFWLLGDLFKTLNFSKLFETNRTLYKDTQLNVSWVCGAFLLTRTCIWRQLKGLDEEYFMYVEDVDYCKRVTQAGYRVEYYPEVKIIHYGGAGRPWLGLRALQNTMRSYVIYTGKFHGSSLALILRPLLATVLALRGLVYGVLGTVKKSTIYKEKCSGFMTVAGELLGRSKP